MSFSQAAFWMLLVVLAAAGGATVGWIARGRNRYRRRAPLPTPPPDARDWTGAFRRIVSGKLR